MAASRELEKGYAQAQHLLVLAAYGRQLSHQSSLDLETRQKLESQRYAALEQVRQLSQNLGDSVLESQATGQLGSMHLDRGQFDLAQAFTRQALLLEQEKGKNPELRYRWQWQLGRVFRRLGDLEKAREAYKQAIATLTPIRAQFFNGYRKDMEKRFHDLVKPVYYELAEVKLSQVKETASGTEQARLLGEVREVIEEMKSAELQELFHDECVIALRNKSKALDDVDKHTAVVYPIVLKNKLVTLLSLPQGIKQYSSEVSQKELEQTVLQFRKHLQTASHKRYFNEAQALYTWLIEPLEKDLASAGIETLVVVPDGSLSLIPLSTLHDGKQFLIEKYALGLTPGLTLTEPQALEDKAVAGLLVGLSEAVQGYSALPSVAKELSRIKEIVDSDDVYLNTLYAEDNVREAFAGKAFRLLHMATHGEFDADPEKSYVLTYDGKLTLDELEKLIKLSEYREESLELLTLSAC